MFRTYIIAICLLFAANFQAVAQKDNARWEKIHTIKVSYITDKIALTPDQSARFWPVYDQYEKEKRDARRNFSRKYKDVNASADAEQARKYVEENLDYQQEEVALKRKYKDQLLQIISAQQLAQLYEAERDFKKLLVDQLRSK